MPTGFSISCKGYSALDAYGRWEIVQAPHTIIQIGKVQFDTSRVVYMCDEGTFSIPLDCLRDVIDYAYGRIEKENRVRRRIADGENPTVPVRPGGAVVAGAPSKGLYEGETAWIVATGPSIRGTPVEKLRGLTIGVNSIIERWTPDYLCVSDPAAIDKFPRIASLAPQVTTIVTDKVQEKHKGLQPARVVRLVGELTNAEDFDEEFEEVYWARSVTLELAIPLAVWLGCKRLLMVGVDGDARGHGVGDDKWRNISGHDFKLKKRYWDSLKKILDKRGVEVINCTPGSNVTTFKRGHYKDWM